MSAKADATVGAINFAAFGVTAVLTPESAMNWGNVIVTIAPAILILVLLWRVHKLDKQHAECMENNAKTQAQLTLAYQALIGETKRAHLPSKEDFLDGNFSVERKGD